MLRDRDIREPLFDFLEDTFGKIRIIEEKQTGKSRADVVMVTENALTGIEIKSDADTYVRLASQVRDYDRFYDYNYVVVGTSHALHIREHVPEHWGVITVEEAKEGLDFYILRQPMRNQKTTWKRKLQILWRPELAVLQEWNGMPKYKEKSKLYVVEKILERLKAGKIEEETLAEQVSTLLFERDYNHVEELLAEYKRSELQKKLEKENDPERQVELMAQRERALKNFKKNVRPRRRRRRRVL